MKRKVVASTVLVLVALSVTVAAVAAVPGTYTGPASRAYLYYADEHKAWINGVKVSIAPKQ